MLQKRGGTRRSARALQEHYTVATGPRALAATTMVAPVCSPTLVPRSPIFPRLLPLPPRPHPIPPAPSYQRRERFINYRDIWREMDELSEEEGAVEAQVRSTYGATRCPRR